MDNTTTFDFRQDSGEYSYTIDSNTILHIMGIGNTIAILYFTDALNNKMDIPDGITVYTYVYQDSNKPVLLRPHTQCYYLCHTDDYMIEMDKRVIIDLKHQRMWNITST